MIAYTCNTLCTLVSIIGSVCRILNYILHITKCHLKGKEGLCTVHNCVLYTVKYGNESTVHLIFQYYSDCLTGSRDYQYNYTNHLTSLLLTKLKDPSQNFDILNLCIFLDLKE